MKKKLSLSVLHQLEPFIHLEGVLFKKMDYDNSLLFLRDVDEGSEFYFKISESRIDQNREKLRIEYKPWNKSSTNYFNGLVEVSKFQEYFSKWCSLLLEYEKVDSFFDDPILKAYEEDFFSDFEFVENDLNNKPPTIKQVKFLHIYLEQYSLKLKEFENLEPSSEVELIQNEIKHIQQNLTLKPKTWIAKKLSGIWARTTKFGIKVFEDFASEEIRLRIKDVIIKGALQSPRLIQLGKDFLDSISD